MKKDHAIKFNIVCAVFRGIIREVFEVEKWQLTPKKNQEARLRISFAGNVANEKLRKRYLYRDVSDFRTQFPIRYLEKKDFKKSI